MDFIIEQWPYVIWFVLGFLSTLPVGKWILHLKGIPQIIARHSSDISKALAADPAISEETRRAITILLTWIKKLVSVAPLTTSREKSKEVMVRASNLLKGEKK